MPPTNFHKQLSPNTQKIYKSKLNALAKAGFDSVQMLTDKPKDVIKAIKDITGLQDDTASRYQRRLILSAIFAVVPDLSSTNNPYYKYYQQCLPLKIGGTDTDWVKKTKYKTED